MEDIQKIKCSSKKHENIEANTYCTKCEKFMCKKCEIIHTDFFDSTHSSFLIKSNDFDNIQLLKDKNINEINDPKVIEENIKYLEDFSNNLKEINNNFKNELKKINNKKEDLEINIQKVFTKIRNELNKVEDAYLNEINNKYDKINLDKKIKGNEILLNKIKLVLNNKINQNDLLIKECQNIDIINKEIENFDKLFDIEIPEEKYINNIIEKIQNLHLTKEYIFDSSIIKNDFKKQKMIDNWIKEKLDTNNIKYELLYKMTENGSKPADFHNCCDNKGATLTIIETKNKNIFGGFTPLNWNTNSRQCYDEHKRTFLFSMNLMKKYEMFNR